MAKLQYGLSEEMLKNMVIANKGKISIKIKQTIISKEIIHADDYEAEM